ncbi:hypothetical protein AcW1_007157 [Taiwanofungus camphoratus]|nr:hypothetical protein AcW1_007157 [Antrodia cinnamomea]
MDKWLSIFAPPVAKRLKKAALGADLRNADVFNLLAMFLFESLAAERASAFCRPFTEDDFCAFDYHGDLEKYYKTGYGEPLGPVQGVGYANELRARPADSPVHDCTQTNASLSSPLRRTLYADFSHENAMVAAIGPFNVCALRDAQSGGWARRVDRVKDGPILGEDEHGTNGVRRAS